MCLGRNIYHLTSLKERRRDDSLFFHRDKASNHFFIVNGAKKDTAQVCSKIGPCTSIVLIVGSNLSQAPLFVCVCFTSLYFNVIYDFIVMFVLLNQFSYAHKDPVPADEEEASSKPTCSCRRSTCILLYCPCFGEGKACHEDCKCKNCKNPLGVNPVSKHTETRAEKKEKRRDDKHAVLAARMGTAASKTPFPALLMLTVSPGRLGLTLVIVPDGGAKIKNIDPACTFRGQLQIGDRIVTIDGKKIRTLEDVKVGKERVRKFGIVKKAIIVADHLKNATGKKNAAAEDSTAAAVTSSVDPRKQVFTHLKELNAHKPDRPSEHRREDILTELLQWDKKHDVNTTAKMGACRYQVICVPLKRRETVNKRELDNQCFHQYNKQTKVFDKFLQAWAS